jgi:hypothetical protein
MVPKSLHQRLINIVEEPRFGTANKLHRQNGPVELPNPVHKGSRPP